MYNKSLGVSEDYAEAVKWYRLAADQGYADAQCNLGVMYDNGQGVPQDYAEA
ncbi:MAG: sel1 repeat family protein, partial [Proteobacteria bacterium]|nr:sel1 repeat family protein [Pseudomonadota bacterium]